MVTEQYSVYPTNVSICSRKKNSVIEFLLFLNNFFFIIQNFNLSNIKNQDLKGLESAEGGVFLIYDFC